MLSDIHSTHWPPWFLEISKKNKYILLRNIHKKAAEQCCIIRFTGKQMLRIILDRDFPRRISPSNVKPLVVSCKQGFLGLSVFGQEIDPPKITSATVCYRLLRNVFGTTKNVVFFYDATFGSTLNMFNLLIGVYPST